MILAESYILISVFCQLTIDLALMPMYITYNEESTVKTSVTNK